jgi:glycosyltransferase involved in cell wall biosynthesis
MVLKRTPRICLVPQLSGVGGMVSFRAKLAQGLSGRGIEVCSALHDESIDAVLVIGGTRQLDRLYALRRRGVRVVQRLDGMNWMHRVRSSARKPEVTLRHYVRAEYGNIILRTIRSRLADGIVYQSEFARRWWERDHGSTQVANTVIYNGVDLDQFNPQGSHRRPDDRYRILLVEGSLMGGYETGLESAVQLVMGLAENPRMSDETKFELMVAGRVSERLQSRGEEWIRRSHAAERVSIVWAGQVPHEAIPELDRSAHVLFSADLNAACPNSVIEALACGLPVVAFDTGALPELVAGGSGKVVPYGGDPWVLEPADIPALVLAAQEILEDQENFRARARGRAVGAFGLNSMVERYLAALL